MIKEVTMYTIICDGCGKDICESEDYSAWNVESYVEDIAVDAAWMKSGCEHYCPGCYSLDNEDNLILKTNTNENSKP